MPKKSRKFKVQGQGSFQPFTKKNHSSSSFISKQKKSNAIKVEKKSAQVPSPAPPSKKAPNPQKNRAAMIMEERQHFAKVLQHPSFQKDPIHAIQTHVRSQTHSSKTIKK